MRPGRELLPLLLPACVAKDQPSASAPCSITVWSTPPAWDAAGGRSADTPGPCNVLIKVGSRPGVTLHVDLTAAEPGTNDTNKRRNKQAQLGLTRVELTAAAH